MNRIDMHLGQASMDWNDDVPIACEVRRYYVKATPAELRKVRAAYQRGIASIDRALAKTRAAR